MTDLRAKLDQFLDLTLDRPWRWGDDDCCMFMANWWAMVHGKDPAFSYRYTYATLRECHVLIRRSFGLKRLVGSIGKRAGARKTTERCLGTMALLRVSTGFFAGKLCGAIWKDGFWIIRTDNGLGFLAPKTVRVVQMWAI